MENRDIEKVWKMFEIIGLCLILLGILLNFTSKPRSGDKELHKFSLILSKSKSSRTKIPLAFISSIAF